MEKYIKENSYRYKKGECEISLLYPSDVTMNYYEIYSIKGELFADIERFDTLLEAEQRIKELLNKQ